MPDKEPLETRNLNIQTICNKIARFAEEMYKSQSGAVSGFSEADRLRFESYINALVAYKVFAETQPILDTPVSHSYEYKVTVKPFPEFEMVDNDAINEIVQMFRMFWLEMLESQSSNRTNGLIDADWKRYDTFIQRFNNLLANYIAPTTYLDSPETIPSLAVPPASPGVNN